MDLINMIEKDVKFLQDNNIIDYSMLIGIEMVNNKDSTGQNDKKENA